MSAPASATAAPTPLDNFTTLFGNLSLYGRLVGIVITSQPLYLDRVCSPLCSVWIAFLGSLLASWLYTCCVADASVCWRSSAAVLVAVQGLTKFYVHTTYAHPLNARFAFLRRIYELNADAHTLNYRLLQRWSAGIRFAVCNGWLPILLTAGVFFAMPLRTWWHDGRLELMLEFWLPGLDHRRSLLAYAALCVYHCATIALAVAGTCGADLTLICMVLHVWPMVEIWAGQWQQLDGALAAGAGAGRQRQLRSAARRAYFRSMLDVHRDISGYMRDISRIYWTMTFCEVFTCSGILCIVLYCYVELSWLQAPILGGLFMIKLLVYCALGTVIELAADRLYAAAVLNDWYRLECAEQRILQMVVLDAQRPHLLLAGTMPLNMVTCVQTLKTVYSVGMLLVQ